MIFRRWKDGATRPAAAEKYCRANVHRHNVRYLERDARRFIRWEPAWFPAKEPAPHFISTERIRIWRVRKGYTDDGWDEHKIQPPTPSDGHQIFLIKQSKNRCSGFPASLRGRQKDSSFVQAQDIILLSSFLCFYKRLYHARLHRPDRPNFMPPGAVCAMES